MDNTDAARETVFACNMGVFTSEQRRLHTESTLALFQAVIEIKELENGYTFRLPDTQTMLHTLADFIAFERLCCPFFAFGVNVEPNGGATWLQLTGTEGVKPFLIAELGDNVSDVLAIPAGFRDNPL